MVLSASVLRTQLVSLTNFSGTHREHADKYVVPISMSVHIFIFCYFFLRFAQISCAAREHFDKPGK